MQQESARELNEGEILQELVQKYNGFKANSAIRRWQISPDQQSAIWCIIIGLDEASRNLLRNHLDHNKWEESGKATKKNNYMLAHFSMVLSGYSESILRLKRHLLNETVKGVTAFWEKLLTVTQLLIPVTTFFCAYFLTLFMLKQFRWHLKSSTCTSWSTTNGGATTVGRWRKAWGLDFGRPKSNGPTMWAIARFSSGWWTNAMVIPAWHLRWLTPWPQPFWMGFSERTCFFYKVFLLGLFVVSDCQGSFQQTKGLQPRFGRYLASKTSEIHSRDDSNVAGPCGAGYPATTGIYEGRRVRGFGPSSGHKAKTVWLFVWCILKEHIYVFVGFTLLFRKCFWCSRNISWTLEEALLSAEYGVAVANLSHDYKEAVSYNLRKNKARFFPKAPPMQQASFKTWVPWEVESNRHVQQASWFQIM